MPKQKGKHLDSENHSNRHKKQKKSHKKQQYKQKKHRRSRSRSRSISSSPSQHNISKDKQIKRQLQTKQKIGRDTLDEKVKEKKQSSNFTRRNKINSNALINIISDQKKVNRKLDDQQVKRAAHNFKQNFVQDIKPVTMSAFLSNQGLIKIIEAKQNKGNLHCQLCQINFQCILQFQRHNEEHKHKQN